MRVAQTVEWNRLELSDRPEPTPGEGQVRLRTRLAGICGSDVHIFHGGHPTARAPIVQGHEFVASVDAIGPGVVGFATGDRVIAEPLISCGACEACRRGHVHVCRKLGLLGIHRDGAFAEAFLADARKLIKVPDDLDDRTAVLAEPFAVGVHVCSRTDLKVGERSLVIGAGPIGMIVAIVARASGAEVTLAEVNAERLDAARAMGFGVIDSKRETPPQVASATNDDGFDSVFEVSGSEPGVALALAAARVRGRIVQVGFFGKTRPACDLQSLIMKELSITGSRVYTYEDFGRTLALLGRLKRSGEVDLGALISEQCGLDGVADGIERMHAGAVRGKILVDPTR